MTVRLRPSEREVIDRVAGGKSARAAFIRHFLFVPGPSIDAIKLAESLAAISEKSEERIGVCLRLTRQELLTLQAKRAPIKIFSDVLKDKPVEMTLRRTFSDVVRDELGMRPISHSFRPAALAISKRGNGPVVTPDLVEAWRRFVEQHVKLQKSFGEAFQ